MKVNLQDEFLAHLQKEKIQITVFLISGYQIRGLVQGFDNYTVIVQSGDTQQLIYKHAISTMVPALHVNLWEEEHV